LEEGKAYIEQLSERNPSQPYRCFGMLYYLDYTASYREELELALACTEQHHAQPPMFNLLANVAAKLTQLEPVAQTLQNRMQGIRIRLASYMGWVSRSEDSGAAADGGGAS